MPIRTRPPRHLAQFLNNLMPPTRMQRSSSTFRIKPSGVLWSPKNGKDWYGVSLPAFAEFVESKGKKQAK